VRQRFSLAESWLLHTLAVGEDEDEDENPCFLCLVASNGESVKSFALASYAW
jgi:hypothetical protein